MQNNAKLILVVSLGLILLGGILAIHRRGNGLEQISMQLAGIGLMQLTVILVVVLVVFLQKDKLNRVGSFLE